jgi:hypothetical protein
MKLSFGKIAIAPLAPSVIAAVVTLSTTASILTQATPSISAPVYVNPTDLQITPGTRGIIQSLTCPDPATTRIKYELIKRYSQYQGRVRITGFVKNNGNQPYISGSNQQGVLLYELHPGGVAPRIVKDQPFQNLAPGQEVKVVFERDWSISDEFPPNYAILLTYDPDITIDGNSKNDDCNLNNNRLERRGSDINALLR